MLHTSSCVLVFKVLFFLFSYSSLLYRTSNSRSPAVCLGVVLLLIMTSVTYNLAHSFGVNYIVYGIGLNV